MRLSIQSTRSFVCSYRTLCCLFCIAVLPGFTVLFFGNPPLAHADGPTDTLTVDASVNAGTPTYRASGFLCPFSSDGTQPPDSLVNPLKIQEIRCNGDGYNSAYDNRETRMNLAHHILELQSNWVDPRGWPNVTSWPCDNNDCSAWSQTCTAVAQQYQGQGNVEYDIWNEPDSTDPSFSKWAGGENQFFQVWKTCYQAIRAVNSNAIIIGPSVSGGSYSSWFSDFVTYVKANAVVPNYFDFHEFGADPVDQVQHARSLLAGVSYQGIEIPEWDFDSFDGQQEAPGGVAWMFARFERAGVASAGHACGNCFGGTLDDFLSGSNPTGGWWVYHRYADITGNLLGVTAGNHLDAVAGADANTQQLRVLVGNNGTSGTMQVRLTNLNSASSVVNGGQTYVTVEDMPQTNNLPAPTIVQQGYATVSNNEVDVNINWGTASDAYSIILSPTPPATGGYAPAAISTQSGSLDMFVRGTDNHLWQRWYRNGSWSSSWANVGGSAVLADSPAVASQGAGQYDLFFRGTDSQLYQISWTGSGWSSATSLGGPTNNTFQGAPAAISTQAGSLDVFVRGNDNHLWQRWYRNGSWSSSWANIGGNATLTDSPAVASQGAGQYDLFFRGTDSQLYQISWIGNCWSSATSLGGPTNNTFQGVPGAISTKSGSLDVFVRGTDNALWQRWYRNGSWSSSWANDSEGAVLSDSPTVASQGADQYDIFMRGTDGQFYQQSWKGSGWSGFSALGQPD